MVMRVQALRSSVKLQRPAAGSREPGEAFFNFADLQFGLIDAGKNPVDLVAVRYFSAATDYVLGNFVVQGGILYRAKGAVPAGAFSAAQWDSLATAVDLSGKEPTIAAGTTAQYWRGDKSWQTHDKASVGLGNVDNTSDANKPISTAQNTINLLKANIDSQTLTGVPRAPTAADGNYTTQLATTQFVGTAVGQMAATLAPTNSPTFTGDPKAPTAAPGDSDTSIATTAFVANAVAPLTGKADIASPVFTGDPRAPTPATSDNDTSIATTAYVKAVVAAVPGAVPGGLATQVQFNDGGTVFAGDAGLTYDKVTDILTAVGGFSTSGNVTAGSFSTSGTIIATGNIAGAAITSSGGISVTNGIVQNPSGGGSLVLAGNGGNCYLRPNGSGSATGQAYVASAGDFYVPEGIVYAQVGMFAALAGSSNAYLCGTGGSVCLRPSSTSITSNQFVYSAAGNITCTGPTAAKSTAGSWVAISDERIKTVKADYTMGLAEIVALQPRVYTYKGNDTVEAPGTMDLDPEDDEPTHASAKAAPYPESTHYQMALDGTEIVGLIAQEAEAVMPELVNITTGFIDGVEHDDVRNIDITNLTYALINAVKELSAKVTALEAAAAA
jgi:hypothetical protein